jgi:hypothetical protein
VFCEWFLVAQYRLGFNDFIERSLPGSFLLEQQGVTLNFEVPKTALSKDIIKGDVLPASPGLNPAQAVGGVEVPPAPLELAGSEPSTSGEASKELKEKMSLQSS